jgi:hypothetical protein
MLTVSNPLMWRRYKEYKSFDDLVPDQYPYKTESGHSLGEEIESFRGHLHSSALPIINTADGIDFVHVKRDTGLCNTIHTMLETCIPYLKLNGKGITANTLCVTYLGVSWSKRGSPRNIARLHAVPGN